MISCEKLFEIFKKNDLSFFTGTPDSTFKDWMKFLIDNHSSRLTNIIACNECEATAIASGHHLVSGKVGVVYMQNSGEGKTINPLTSLCDPEVYSIPVMLMVGWRGEPGKPDEPQHKKMGKVMIPLLETLEVPYRILPGDLTGIEKDIEEMKQMAEKRKGPTAIIIRKGLLEKYEEQKPKVESPYQMTREEAIKIIVNNLNSPDIVISTTGKTSRELFECRVSRKEIPHDFYTVGSMGCSASIALGIALEGPARRVFVFDGDGAVIMQMGSLATIGNYKPKNLFHLIFDNASYESTGGQPTVPVDFDRVALGCGYRSAFVVDNKDELIEVIDKIKEGPCLIVIKVKKGSREDLGRPTTTPMENKEKFMDFLRRDSQNLRKCSDKKNDIKIKRNILLNPGPATTTDTVKMAQVVPDICPREKEFGEVMEFVSEHLKKIVGGDEDYACVLFGGSGTAGVDAVINSVVPINRKILIINNSAYGERMVKIAQAYSLPYVELKFEWDSLPDLKEIEKMLSLDTEIACISMVHHETTTGMLNPVAEVGKLAKKYDCIFVVDAISSFAGLPIDIKELNIDFLISSSNKCIQGIAGCVFVICKKNEVEKLKDYPKRSFYLNLYDQYKYFKDSYQMHFTPPVQVIYALKQAIIEFEEEAGERYKRYAKNWETLVLGMEKLGFKRLLKDEEESRILTTFLEPEDLNYDFNKMHDLLYSRGFTIYPGKMNNKKTFRIANIGAIDHTDIIHFLECLEEVLGEMGVKLK